MPPHAPICPPMPPHAPPTPQWLQTLAVRAAHGSPGPGAPLRSVTWGLGPWAGAQGSEPGGAATICYGGQIWADWGPRYPTIPPRPPRLLQILDAFDGILLGFAGGLALLELRLVLLYLVGAGWMGGWD